jgi:glycine/D-amino acid oxidase-like deaminating enzyme
VIAGGEDEDIADEQARDALTGRKIKALQKKLHALLPEIDVTADFAWAGTFGESGTSLPTIGPIPGMPRCYAILGYGGNGITFSMIAAQVLLGYIHGPRDRDGDLFSFDAMRR